jgi:hypothetical protein
MLWLLYAPTTLASAHLCEHLATRAVAQLHKLFCLLHQAARDLAQKASHQTCRDTLESFLHEIMPTFESKGTGSWCTMYDMYAPMSPHRGLPLINIDGEVFRGALRGPPQHSRAPRVALQLTLPLKPPCLVQRRVQRLHSG